MIGNQNLDFREDKLFLDVGNDVSIIFNDGDMEFKTRLTMKQFEELDDEYRNQVNELNHKNKEDKILKLEAENEELKYQIEMRDDALYQRGR